MLQAGADTWSYHSCEPVCSGAGATFVLYPKLSWCLRVLQVLWTCNTSFALHLGLLLLLLYDPVSFVSNVTQGVATVLNTTMNCAEGKAVDGKAQLEDVAKLANELQPTGSSLATANVQTKVNLFTHSHLLRWLLMLILMATE